MIFTFPIRIESEANKCEHWRKKHARNKRMEEFLRASLTSQITPSLLPCTVKLTRIAPRKLDDDNLRASGLKKVRDTIASMLIPGLQPGRADDDSKAIQWEYAQEKGKPKEYALKIEIITSLKETNDIRA